MSRLAAALSPSGLAFIAFLAAVPAFSQNAAPAVPAPPELRVFDTSLIDKSVNPCENFYQYSCNGWFKSYNFGSLAAAELRWHAAQQAGVDYIASDQYEQLGSYLRGLK